MADKIIMSQLFPQAMSTLVAVIFISVLAVIIFLVLRKRISSKKQLRRVRSRMTYISIVVFLLILIRIWIEGFTHLFTMLSLVAAGLVVTNKENIMNFAGWIIINWRGLFSEGDYIQVQNYTGHVSEIKILYFTLQETTELGHTQLTGKSIKIPNGLIITNPVITFSLDNNFLLHKIPYVVNTDIVDPIAVANTAKRIIYGLLQNKYAFDSEFLSSPVLLKHNIKLNDFNLKPQVELKLYNDKEKLVNIQASFYCIAEDIRYLEFEYTKALLVK